MIAFEATKNDVMKTWESKTAMCAARPYAEGDSLPFLGTRHAVAQKLGRREQQNPNIAQAKRECALAATAHAAAVSNRTLST